MREILSPIVRQLANSTASADRAAQKIHSSFMLWCMKMDDTIYPTPPLGQDMTQGQFLSRV